MRQTLTAKKRSAFATAVPPTSPKPKPHPGIVASVPSPDILSRSNNLPVFLQHNNYCPCRKLRTDRPPHKKKNLRHFGYSRPPLSSKAPMSSPAKQSDPYARAADKFSLACKLTSIESLLMWDAQTNMPKGGTWARGEQIGALAEVTSDLTGAREIGDLLDEAEAYANRLSDAERANLKEMRRLWLHRAAVPKAL